MSYNIHHDDLFIHGESARERQRQDNEAENAPHNNNLGCASLTRYKILPATSEIEESLVQVVIRDRLRLKPAGSVMEDILSSDRKEKKDYKVKIATTSFKKNNSGRRQEG